MIRPSILLIALLTIWLFSVELAAQSTKSEEYRVYDAVISDMFAGKKMTFDVGVKVNRVIIQDVTISTYAISEKSEWDRIKPRFKSLTDDLIADYESKLKKPARLARLFDLDLEYSLVPKAELDTIHDRHGDFDKTTEAWKTFYKRYPDSGGYNSFSTVGFNKESDRALVYFVNWCGPLCGSGHYLILGKQLGKWGVLEKNMIWIS